jgi:hypothetical protein
MLLGLSSAAEALEVDLSAVMGSGSDTGVDHGAEILDFVEAVLYVVEGRCSETGETGETGSLEDVRSKAQLAIGHDGVVDVAAIVANFQMMTRLADATGAPLEEGIAEASRGMRSELGVDGFDNADPDLDP